MQVRRPARGGARALAARPPPAGPGPRGCAAGSSGAAGGRLRLGLAIIPLGGWLHLSPVHLPPPAPAPAPPAAAPPPAAARRSVDRRRTQGRKSGQLARGQGLLAAVPPPPGPPTSGRAGKTKAGRGPEAGEAGASCAGPWEPGKGLEEGPRTGPCWGLRDQSGCYHTEQGPQGRGGRGAGGCGARVASRGTWEGLTLGGPRVEMRPGKAQGRHHPHLGCPPPAPREAGAVGSLSAPLQGGASH